MHFKAKLSFLLIITFIITSNSCSHYSVINTDLAPFKSIYIHTIANQDYAPNIHTLFQNQIKNTILRGSKLVLSDNPEDADTQLYISIDNYKRNANTRSSLDAGRFNSLDLKIIILVSLYDNRTNNYLLKNVPLEHSNFLYLKEVTTSFPFDPELISTSTPKRCHTRFLSFF